MNDTGTAKVIVMYASKKWEWEELFVTRLTGGYYHDHFVIEQKAIDQAQKKLDKSKKLGFIVAAKLVAIVDHG